MTLPVYTMHPALVMDISRVPGQFQEWEKDALARGLRACQHRQVTKSSVGTGPLFDPLRP